MLMKNKFLIAFLICAAVSVQAQIAPTPASQTVTNLLPGQEMVKARLAPPLAVSAATVLPQQLPTNGLGAGATLELPSTLERGIIPTASGAEANFGRHKASFATDAAEARPVTVITPDGQKLSFRVSFLVLANRATGQNLLLGAITNSVGQISAPDRLIWTNIFDTGPRADIEYRYSGTEGFLEQNIVLRQSPTLPKDWQPSDVALECWTEFFDSVPLSKESQ